LFARVYMFNIGVIVAAVIGITVALWEMSDIWREQRPIPLRVAGLVLLGFVILVLAGIAVEHFRRLILRLSKNAHQRGDVS
jgi:hypothetical protein